MSVIDKDGMNGGVDGPVAGAHRGGSSRFRGVCWNSHQNRWIVQIQCRGKRRLVGAFRDEMEAAKAYDKAAREVHGEFARLNFPDDCDQQRVLAPPGMVGRREAMRMLGVGLKTWQRWEREGVIDFGKIIMLPSGGRSKVYPRAEIERFVEEGGRYSPPYPDPDRPGCYRVPLTGLGIRRREAIIDARSLPIVEGERWRWSEGATPGTGMVVRGRFQNATPLRRIIMGVEDVPCDQVIIGHVNGDPLDCRRANLVRRTITLRLAAARKRRTNNGKPCTSRFKGVCWHSQREQWFVQVTCRGKKRYAGFYDDEIDAAEAYDKAAREIFGEHARLNFPDDCSRNVEEAALARAA